MDRFGNGLSVKYIIFMLFIRTIHHYQPGGPLPSMSAPLTAGVAFIPYPKSGKAISMFDIFYTQQYPYINPEKVMCNQIMRHQTRMTIYANNDNLRQYIVIAYNVVC
jgi:hypothetical protein